MNCEMCHQRTANNIRHETSLGWLIVCDECTDKTPPSSNRHYSFGLPRTLAELRHWDEHLLRKSWVKANAERWAVTRRRIELLIEGAANGY